MEDAMDMSLDDYISSFQQTKTSKKANDLALKEESKFKEGRREQVEDNEEEEDEEELILQCHEDDYKSLALKDDELDLGQSGSNDLRNKIVGRIPSSNSQQWRLMQPNVIQSRPAGMPPLIPSGMTSYGLSGNRGNWRNYNRCRNFFGRQNWNNNSYNHNNYHNNNNNNRNNGRIQRFNNTRSNLNSKNIKIVLQQLKERNPMILFSEVGAPDLTIEATTNEQNKNNGLTHISMPMQMKPNLPPVVGEAESSAQPKASEAIKSLLGVSEVGLRNEMMPALAGKLLDFLNGTNATVHKPVYDMKIQKEIHDIQKKPLLYKCPGGEVVSSDGVGIPNCRIQPKSSGVSLNNRFA